MSIKIRALTGVMVGIRALQPGEEVAVDSLTAATVIATGRAELAHKADAEAVAEAVRADALKAIKRAGRPWQAPEAVAPWTRRA